MHPFKTTLKINAKSAEMFNFALINENMNNQKTKKMLFNFS